MRPWRTAALALGTLLASLLGIVAIVYANRSDLVWLVAHPAPAPAAPAARPARPAKPAPPLPEPPPPASAPPAPRRLSWSGLTVTPCTDPVRLDASVRKVLGNLDQDLLDGVKDLKDASGLFPTAADRIRIQPLSYWEATFREPFAEVPAREGVRVDLPLEPLALGWWQPRQVLAAALAMGILQQEAPGYAQAPTWVRAGIALELSGFGQLYARRTILDSDRPPLQLVRPLSESGDLAWVDGYWACSALVAQSGDEALRRWVEAMRAGEPWDSALERTCGLSAQGLDAAYRARTTALLRDLCANREALLDAVAMLRQQREQDALPLLEDFVKNKPLDLYCGNARYYLNYARVRVGNYDRAIDGFTDLLVNYPSTTSWQAKARYFLGRAYQLSGYAPLALPEYQRAALDPDDALLVKLAKQRIKEVQ